MVLFLATVFKPLFFLSLLLVLGNGVWAADLDALSPVPNPICGGATLCSANNVIAPAQYVLPVKQTSSAKKIIKYYFSPQCPHCRELKRTLLPELRKKYSGKIEIQEFDIVGNPLYLQELMALSKNYRNDVARIPSMLIEGQFLVGTVEINLESIQKILNLETVAKPVQSSKPMVIPSPILQRSQEGEVNSIYDASKEKIKSEFPELNLLMAAALLDGINPCAFATIIFFVTYLNFLKKDKKYIAQIGLAFVVGVFICYFGLGLGIFHVFIKLKAYDWISYWFSKVLGVFALILGVLSLYDFYIFKKSGQSSEMVLQLPTRLKQIIHAIIRRGVASKPGQEDSK